MQGDVKLVLFPSYTPWMVECAGCGRMLSEFEFLLLEVVGGSEDGAPIMVCKDCAKTRLIFPESEPTLEPAERTERSRPGSEGTAMLESPNG